MLEKISTYLNVAIKQTPPFGLRKRAEHTTLHQTKYVKQKSLYLFIYELQQYKTLLKLFLNYCQYNVSGMFTHADVIIRFTFRRKIHNKGCTIFDYQLVHIL